LPDLFLVQDDKGSNMQSSPATVYEWTNYFANQLAALRHVFRDTIKVVHLLLAVSAILQLAPNAHSVH